MTLIRKWVLVVCSALLCLSYSASINAQQAGTIDPTTGAPILVTGNQLNSTGWSGQSRTGALNGANPRDSLGCCTGSGAYVDTSNGGAIYFSYSTTTVSQGVNINNALANAGSGVRVSGVNYDFQYYNQDGNRGTLSSTLNVTGTGGGSVTRQHSATTGGWTDYSNTLPLQGAQLSALGTATLSFTGRDDRFWAGYYGPAVRNPHLSIAYTVDPCAANPAYSTTCAGFGSVATTDNQVPNPNGYAYGGDSINNSFAVNKGLEMAGTGLKVHGWQWGYVANANGPYCNAWNIFGFCLFGQDITPSVTTNVNITDKAGASIYAIQRTYTNSYNTTDYQYILPSSRLLSTIGNFNFTATTNDQAYVGSMWAKTMYTPDQCMLNPLSSSSCPGYLKAFHDQQCSINPLFAADCPGYAVALKQQQCTNNPLSYSDCSGYAAATTQCSANPLYASYCPSYATATSQCSANPLTGSYCPGYAQAYFNQQCTANPLSSSQCSGYTSASSQCSTNPLTASYCPGYSTASNQCTSNALYASYCPGYQQAFALKTVSTTKTANTTTSPTTTTSTDTAPTTTAVTTTPTTTAATTTTATTTSAPSTASTTTTAEVTQPTTTTASTTSAPTATAAATAAVSATPSANNPQPKVGEVTTAGSQASASKSTMSTSQVLNMISSQQAQQTKLEMSAVQSATAQANQDAAKATNEAQAVAAAQQAQTLTNAQEVTAKETAKAQSATVSTGLSPLSVGLGVGLISIQSNTSVVSIGSIRGPDLYSLTQQQTGPSTSFSISNYSPMPNNYRIEKEETRSFEQSSSFDNRNTMSSTNPLANAMNPPILIAPLPPAPTGPSVNAKVKDNDAAGGISIASIAKQPQGFELYMSGLQDRPFYSPKEIYKGQAVVDNARAQRMLSGASDRLHQQMVDSQYNLGN